MEQKQLLNKEIFPIRLKEIMLENNQTIYTLSQRINLSAATVSRYCSGKMAPKLTTIEVIAKQFGINPAWLMGYDVDKLIEKKQPDRKYYQITEKDKKDIAKQLEKMLDGLGDDKNGFAAFDGEPLDEATKMVLKDSLERSMLLAREIAKKKFTPKKYRN
ncbi:TPA: helix-turn-helix domain-containing protein [Bacillus thuringiensis]|nr:MULTISPECIES: helix-turn-helix transcriptional regulator [Bacillus cereus group]AJA17561.1 hypothetical protein BT4G5_01025 [Bacillus thuringiensis serovar galleriae]KAB1368383.1 helix-turn-helix transcriptional regulator [Bacillus thuringiensis]KIP29101.1 helix-turn-helix family protein [Bacillus thuringiensis serovar morrisoni]KMQ11267.1 hypothetical protein TU66_16045 [Bacillus cereus]MCC3876066.1 helix-turn-helix domain-containing protein [Bacillus thuringiensis]